EEVEVHGVDLGSAFNSVRRGAVSRNVEGLVRIVGAIEVVRRAQAVCRVHIPVVLTEDGGVVNLVFHRQAFVLIAGALKEVEQSDALAFGISSNQSVTTSDHWSTCACAQWSAQIRPIEVFQNLLNGAEEEHLLLNDWTTDRSTKLLAVKVLQRLAVGGIGA